MKTSLLKLGLVLFLGASQWVQAQAPPPAETEAEKEVPAPVKPNENPEEETRRTLPGVISKTNTSPTQITNRAATTFSRATNASTNLPALRGFTSAPTPRGTNALALPQPQTLPLRGPNPNAAQIPAIPGATPSSPTQTPPGLPGPTRITYSSTNVTISGEEVTLNFLPNTPFEAVFDTYSRLTGRTVLRPNVLPGGLITIKTVNPLTREEAIQALNSVFALNGIVMIPVGERFVKAVPPATAVGEGTPFSETATAAMSEGDHYVTQIVKIKNAPAGDVAKAIAPLSKTPNQVVAIEASQTIILRDVASVVKRMMEVIEKIDVAPEQEYKLEVIPIKYGKVTELYDTMNSLVSGQASVGGGAATRSSVTPTGRRGNLRGPSNMGGASQTGINPATGQPYSTQQLGGRGNVGAARTDFQGRLQQIVNRAASPTGDLQILGDARIVPDERSNSIIVYANKEDMKMITNIVAKVDVLLAQVLIEAIVLEVGLGDKFDFGLTAVQKRVQSGDFTGAGMLRNPGNTGIGILDPNSPLVGGTNGPSIPGGFSYFAELGPNFNVALSMVASDSRANIMQRPRIQTSHAVPGSFFIGDTVPYASGFYDNFYGGIQGGTRANVQQLEVGTSLEVTPFITPDGLVVLDIYQEISQVTEFVEVTAGTRVPSTSTRNAQATLSVRDGDTIMLGGYITEAKRRNKSGVPVLKDIPVLGALFRSKSTEDSRAEIVILMHVTVLRSPADAGIQAQAEKSSSIRALEKEFKDQELKRNQQLQWESRPK